MKKKTEQTKETLKKGGKDHSPERSPSPNKQDKKQEKKPESLEKHEEEKEKQVFKRKYFLLIISNKLSQLKSLKNLKVMMKNKIQFLKILLWLSMTLHFLSQQRSTIKKHLTN